MTRANGVGAHDYLGCRDFARPIGSCDVLQGRGGFPRGVFCTLVATSAPALVPTALPQLHEHTLAFRARKAVYPVIRAVRRYWGAALIALAFLLVGRWDYEDELQRARELAARHQSHQLDRADLSARLSKEIPQ